jgi:fibronectin-binding autotransporter adhesin
MKTNLKNRILSTANLSYPLAAAIAMMLTAQSASATQLYWDVNGATASYSLSATGAWDGTNNFWNTDSGGGSGTLSAVTTSADDLNLSSVITSGIITLTGTGTASSLTNNAAGATTLTGGTLALGGTGASSGIFMTGSAGNFTVASAVTLNNGPITLQNTGTGKALIVNGTITGSQNLILNNTGTGLISLTNVNNTGTITDNGIGTATNTLTTVGSNVTSVTLGTANGHTLALTNLTVNSGGTTLTNNSVAAKAIGASMVVTGTGDLLLNGSANFSAPFAAISSVNNSGNVTFAMTGSSAGQTITTVGSSVTGITQNSASLLTLTNAQAFTGNVTVNANKLQVNFASNTGNNSAGVLTLGGGHLSETGKAATFSSQTFTSTTLNAGASTLSAIRGDTTASSAMVINLGAITRNPGSTVAFANPNITNQALSASNGFTTTNTNTNGIIGGWATVNNAGFASNFGTHIVNVATTDNTWTSGTNNNIFPAGAINIGAGADVNSVRINTAGATTITLGGTSIIQSGGILVGTGVGVNLTTITGGTLKGASGAELIIHQLNPSGLTIDSTIADNTSATGLTKSGTGILTLGGTNTYSGNTIINAGTLSLGTGTTNTSLADTAGVVIAADSTAVLNLNYTGTDTIASLTIKGVAKASGVWGSSTSGAPNTDPKLTGTGTLTVGAASPYSTWAGGAGFYDDANSDGVDNGLAWLLGAADPNVSALSLLPTPTVSGGNLTLSTFNRVNPKGSAKLFVEYSNDLSAWTPVETATANGVYPTGNITITIAGTSPQTVSVTVSSAASASGKLFARLRASEN